MKSFEIGPGLKLPVDAVTETFAILGRRGSGKTHTAVVMAEDMLQAGLQVVVLDPLDVWWGLRVSKDGKTGGYPIYVAGGSHADIPLTADAGRILADAVVDRGLSIVLSLRHLSKTDQRRFVGEFCERLYDRKADPKHRTALHVFIDEADAFVPQRLVPGSERCFGAVDTAVRRGRSSGLGVTLISQRPQVINKDVLSQTEVLVSHQLTGPQDRKALEAWIEANDTENQRAVFMASLASLPKGTAWFWSPGLLRIFTKVQVRDRYTFDSSATPKAGVTAVASPKAFAKVDLEALTAEITATIERQKADDPRELRKQIVLLKAQLAERGLSGIRNADVPKIIEKPVLKDGQLARAEKILATVDRLIGRAESVIAEMGGEVVQELRKVTSEIAGAIASTRAPQPHTHAREAAPRPAPRATQPAASPGRSDAGGSARPAAERNGDLTGPEQRIIDAIAWLEAIGVVPAEQTAVAFLAGYTYGAGGFNNPRGSLRQRGFVEYLPGERIQLTDAGRALANAPDAPLDAAQLHERVLARLPGPEQRLLRPLLESYPKPMSNEDLAERANYAVGTGGFNNPKGRLRTLGLIDYPQPGYAVAKSLLFLQ